MQNHFELFGLPIQFTLDRERLDKAYKEVQQLVHPDRYVTATAAEKRTAMQWATLANDAYQILRNPVKRAAYLCELNGYHVQNDCHNTMAPDFLMQQIEWRESLENSREAKNIAQLELLENQLRNLRQQQLQIIEQNLEKRQFEQTIQEIRKMMFLEKFNDEINQAFDELDSVN